MNNSQTDKCSFQSMGTKEPPTLPSSSFSLHQMYLFSDAVAYMYKAKAMYYSMKIRDGNEILV